jgi:hypothetical protein
MSGDRGERRYRRLLWAYPRAYRKRFGDEIVTTLLDAAAQDGHGDPARGLVRAGIRARFSVRGLAARMFAAVAALTVAAGLTGVLAFAAWQVSAVRLPSDASAVAMFRLPGAPPPEVVGEDHRAFGDQPGNSTADFWMVGSTEYGPGYIDLSQYYRGDPRTSGVVLRDTVTALARQGWTVDGWPTTAPNEYGCCPEAHLHRGGLVLDLTAEYGGYGSPDMSPESYADFQISYTIEEATPAAVVPWILAGLVAGVVAGWLVAAWLVRRVRAVRGTLAWFGITVGLLVPATLLSLACAVASVIGPPGWATPPAWAGYTMYGTRLLTWLGLIVLAIAFVEITARQPAAPRDEPAGPVLG